ncbi:hypothetical protein Tco_0742078 [Tanacetum coccineum]
MVIWLQNNLEATNIKDVLLTLCPRTSFYTPRIVVRTTKETVNTAGTTTTTTTATITDVEITLAQALIELKSAKPKAVKIMIQELENGTTTTTPTTIIFIRLDEELAFKLQAKEEEEERLAREKAQQTEEANIASDDVQAKIEADYQLAQRLQAQEREEEQTTNKSLTKEYHVYLSKKHGRMEAQKFEEQVLCQYSRINAKGNMEKRRGRKGEG